MIAATMVWLRLAHDVQRFLILCPNLIVRDRLEADFRGGRVFLERDLIPPGAIVSAEDFALTTLGGDSRAKASDLFGANVVLANIHQFYRSSATGRQTCGACWKRIGRHSLSSTTRRTTHRRRSTTPHCGISKATTASASAWTPPRHPTARTAGPSIAA